nr:hypothetical protein [Neobacillus sp. Marseille-Q6967]
MTKLLVSCVGEDNEKYHFRVLTLFKTIKQFGGKIGNAKLIANFVSSVNENVRRSLNDLGVRVEVVERFDTRSPHCNKLRMFEIDEDYDIFVALDCDIAVVRDFTEAIKTDGIYAPFHPLQPLTLEQWKQMFSYFNLQIPQNERKIHYSSGVLTIPKSDVKKLRETWGNYALALLNDFFPAYPEIGAHKFFTDQFALALTFSDLKMDVPHLPDEMNYGTYFTQQPKSIFDHIHPYLLHYSFNVDEQRRLILKSGNVMPDYYIDMVNKFNNAKK